MTTHDISESAPPTRPSDGADTRPDTAIDSAALLGTARQVTIRHGGQDYTLRVTRAGKLILTK